MLMPKTADLTPTATLADYFNEHPISDQLYSACEDFEFFDWMFARIEDISENGEWNEQLTSLLYYLAEMKMVIKEIEALLINAPDWPVTLNAMKRYAFAIGKAKECQTSIMVIARQSLLEEFPDVCNSVNEMKVAQ